MSKLNEKEYSKLLEGVLKGIPDIIGVYKPDRTAVMYNKAGYDFFQNTFKKPMEIVYGRKCYEIFEEENICKECKLQECLKQRKLIRFERYIEKINKYIDCSYNPIMDDDGRVIFVVEQLRDITEEKMLRMSLEESEERYRKIVEFSLDGIVISVDNKIVFTNSKLSQILGEDLKETMNKKFIDLMPKGKTSNAHNYINKILKENLSEIIFEHKFINTKGEAVYVEVIASCVTYMGQPAILSVVRDITKIKKELYRAAKIQRESLPKNFPLDEKVEIEYIYKPAKTVSGDFFQFNKINDNLIIGILFDVSGNGISASLNVSAFKILFDEATKKLKEPKDIIRYLNKKVTDYLGETYIAASCFSLDFKNQKMKIVSAGINEFTIILKNEKMKNEILKGPFLGMFQNSIFDESEIKFSKGDKVLLYSDGLEKLFKNPEMENKSIDKSNLEELENIISKFLYNSDKNKDDCTLIVMKIK